MEPDAFAALAAPSLCDAMARTAVNDVLLNLATDGDTHTSHWLAGSLSDLVRQFDYFSSANANDIAEAAYVAQEHATNIRADFLIVVIDFPGRPRTVRIGIETRVGCYEATFKVVQGPDRVRELGRGKFAPVGQLSPPFDGVFTARWF